MEFREFGYFVAAMQTYYPRENPVPTKQAAELWFKQLEDIPYKVAEVALNKWVATNKWPPSIADIREYAATVTKGETPDWGEGWEKVNKAIRYYGMYRADEALASLDDLTRQCAERLGFRNLCLSEDQNQDRANFRMIYEELSERQRKSAQIPMNVKVAISAIQNDQKLLTDQK